jgi:hypothetical protein
MTSPTNNPANSCTVPPVSIATARPGLPTKSNVMLYLIRIADKLNINLIDAAKEKMVLNAQKYPVEKARGSAKKYDEL